MSGNSHTTSNNTAEPTKRKSKLRKKNRNIPKSVLETVEHNIEETPPKLQEAAINATAAKAVEEGVGRSAATVKDCTTPRLPGTNMIDLTKSPMPITTTHSPMNEAAAKITPISTQSTDQDREKKSDRSVLMPTSPDLSSPPMSKENKLNEVSVAVLSSKNKQKSDATLPHGGVTSSFAAAASSSLDEGAPVIQSGSTAKSKEPLPPKKKKHSFHDRILYRMLTSCKPYTLKSLAKETSITVDALQHAMLSFLDKKLVLSKEFPAKKGSAREPKKLYWANPLTLADIEDGNICSNGKKNNGGGAVVKDFSKLLSTSKEIEEARQLRHALEQRHQELKNELIPLLTIPTMKELNDQIMIEEQKLAEATSKTQAVRDRIANSSNNQYKNVTKPCSGAFASAPANRFQRKPPSKPRDPTTLKRKINYMLTEYKTRKRKCMDFVEELSDAMEKKSKDVMSDKVLGLDTDEMEWEWYEDRGSGKVFGTRSKRQKLGMLVAGSKKDSMEEQTPSVIIPAKYKL